MRKIVKFRVYPESPHGFYFDVEVHPTVERMRKAATKAGGNPQNFNDAQACVRAFSKGYQDPGKPIVWTKTLGTFFFHKDRLGMEIITHECSHAALRWMEAKKFDVSDRSAPDYEPGMASENEERFCYALGSMATQIVSKLYEAGMYETITAIKQ